MTIDIHKASQEEMLAADKNSYEVWGEGSSMEEYLIACQTSPRKNRAQCWVLTMNGVVASSLECHSLLFWHYGSLYSGFGIASVYTHLEMRRQGLAEKLCRYVINVKIENGAQFGLLFSDIAPDYYHKMGFHLSSVLSYDYHDLGGLRSSGNQAKIKLFDPQKEHDWLVDIHRQYHCNTALTVARDGAYWAYSLRANSKNLFWLVLDDKGERLGYVRLYVDQQRAGLIECIIPRQEPLVNSVYRSISRELINRQVERLTSWLTPPQGIVDYSAVRKRSKAWPMVWMGSQINASPEAVLADTSIYSSDYF